MTDSTPLPPRLIETEALKALAHPLRVALLEELSTYGPSTASGLAARLGESSGATSYHLRHLARHDFVREVEGRGTGRERWWERVPGGITLSSLGKEPGSAEYAASELVAREWERHRAHLLEDFARRGHIALGDDWIAASELSTANLRLTLDETRELRDRLEAAWSQITDEYRGRANVGAMPIQVHLNVFPVVDGTPIREDA
jgi:DNA-binding transcriptional ArsR family regulator